MNGNIRFINENKGRNAVKFKELPKRARMVLHTVRCTDNKDRVIQKRKRSFRFRRKIHVPGRVQQDEITILTRKTRLLGKDRNASFPFHGIGIQICIFMIDASQLANLARVIKKRFRKRRFPCVDVSQNADDQFLFHAVSPYRKSLFRSQMIGSLIYYYYKGKRHPNAI